MKKIERPEDFGSSAYGGCSIQIRQTKRASLAGAH